MIFYKSIDQAIKATNNDIKYRYVYKHEQVKDHGTLYSIHKRKYTPKSGFTTLVAWRKQRRIGWQFLGESNIKI